MNTSILQAGLNPPSTHCRPPEWLGREIAARSRRKQTAVRHSRPRTVNNGRATVIGYRRTRHKQFDNAEYRSVRLTALASILAAVAWTSFCVTTAFVRLDSSNFGKWRDGLISSDEPKMTLGERLEAATAALREVSSQVLVPVVDVVDSIGVADSALPLSMRVTHYMNDTKIVIRGLPVGTTLTSGASIGGRDWRINVEDLPHAYVIPPHGYVGVVALVAELRDIDGHPLTRTPVQFTWAAVDGSSTIEKEEPAETEPPVTAVAAVAGAADAQNQQLFRQFVDRQKEKIVLPKPRPIRHASLGAKTSRPKKQIAHRYNERVPPRGLYVSADTRPSNEMPLRSSFAAPDPRRERPAIVDSIFRNVFFGDGRNASSECEPATLKRGTQKKSGDDCQWSR